MLFLRILYLVLFTDSIINVKLYSQWIFSTVVFTVFFKKLTVYFLILHLTHSHFIWSSRMFSLISSFKVTIISLFFWWIYSSFSIKLLLNFQKPLPLKHENITGNDQLRGKLGRQLWDLQRTRNVEIIKASLN